MQLITYTTYLRTARVPYINMAADVNRRYSKIFKSNNEFQYFVPQSVIPKKKLLLDAGTQVFPLNMYWYFLMSSLLSLMLNYIMGLNFNHFILLIV